MSYTVDFQYAISIYSSCFSLAFLGGCYFIFLFTEQVTFSCLGSLKRANEGVWRRKKGDTVLLCFRNTMLFVVVIKPKDKHCVPGHPSSERSQGLLCALMPAV